MPGFTTHYILGMKAYNDLPVSQLKHIIAKYRWLYQLGLQGPDMFFYNIPILRHRDYRNVGSYMHEHHINDFFRCCLTHLSRLPYKQQREQGISFLAGFLCHYIGDSICHPYVYGRINYDINNPSTYHHGLHASLENDIDAILLKKYKQKKPSEFNQAATICLNGLEMQFISHFLSSCINETYYPISYKNNFQVTPRMVSRSILALRFGCRTLADKSGRKKNSIKFVESIFLKNPVASTKIVTDSVSSPRYCLNSDHEVWCNPWKKSLASTASFPELFHQSLAKCSTIYYQLNSILTSPIPLEEQDFHLILSELGNYSYHSGLSVSD
ncbi:zinc dependent phospholipase C family protein [Lachnospiraceae bacterium 62-35]